MKQKRKKIYKIVVVIECINIKHLPLQIKGMHYSTQKKKKAD